MSRIEAWQESGVYRTDSDIFTTAEDLLVLLSILPDWPQARWELLQRTIELARAVDDGARTRQTWHRPRIAESDLAAIYKVVEHVAVISNPPEPTKPRVVKLETLAELETQKLSILQTCRIYGWMLPDGQPDTEKYRLAKEGKIEVPTTVERPATTGRHRMPHPGLLHAVVDRLVYERELKPADIEDVITFYAAGGDETDEDEEVPEEDQT